MINWTRQLFRGARWATKPIKPHRRRQQHAYRFTFPDRDTVTIRAYNQRQARADVRNALSLTRLPAGTDVVRVD